MKTKRLRTITFPVATMLLMAALVLGAGSNQAEAAPSPIRVEADLEWVDTGISLETGQTVYLNTHSVAITGPLAEYPDALSGPGGQVWNLGCGQYPEAPPPCALDDAPYGALVGRIGPSGAPFLIGDASSFTSTAAGDLYLAVNDNLGAYADNLAGFTVLLSK